MSTKTAMRIKDELAGFSGRAALYRLSEPLGSDWTEDETKSDLVVVSAAHVCGRPETYIFAADEQGNVTNWCELPGSMKDTLSHEEALEHAGYSVKEAA